MRAAPKGFLIDALCREAGSTSHCHLHPSLRDSLRACRQPSATGEGPSAEDPCAFPSAGWEIELSKQ